MSLLIFSSLTPYTTDTYDFIPFPTVTLTPSPHPPARPRNTLSTPHNRYRNTP
jgi:hypothetical protein